MAQREEPSPRDTLVAVRAWADARALPEVDDEWHEGYEFLRRKLIARLDDQGQHEVTPPA